METPKTLSGRITEEIMHIFWGAANPVKLADGDYNRVYSHVLTTLSAHLDGRTRTREEQHGKQ